MVVRTYSYAGEALADSRMGVFLKAIEAASAAQGQGFAAIKVGCRGDMPCSGLQGSHDMPWAAKHACMHGCSDEAWVQ